jgi:hypothetical protein
MIWEDERIAEWQTTGTVPSPVMVWTGEQLNSVLAHAAAHEPDLHPLFHLIAYRGPRRGEACGLRDRDVHLAKHEVVINNQITAVVPTIREKRPKSRARNRILVLDADTAAAQYVRGLHGTARLIRFGQALLVRGRTVRSIVVVVPHARRTGPVRPGGA